MQPSYRAVGYRKNRLDNKDLIYGVFISIAFLLGLIWGYQIKHRDNLEDRAIQRWENCLQQKK